ncbi:RNA-helicase DExH-NPH-II domain [NY_014 poxvirus]|uniref:RNA-helicase DExH-NPH-II domain n=1 Tax=NY_014 poxvirus TaxID=2025360 RepID=UPI000B9A1117|nr:RNA-helicase DExH-NPH-II domain [NY_014 poxvirus]AST09470.1 RNA-helicase DExH-NPH-II domain [NY_014 poxvirus]
MNNLPDIFFFPNCVNIFSYNYSQDEFSKMSDVEKKNFSLTVFPILKHRWNGAYVIKHRNIYRVSSEAQGEKVKLESLNHPEYVNIKTKQYTVDGIKISFECYSFIKCSMNTDIDSFDEYVLRGLIEAGNKLKIFSNSVGNQESSVGVFGNREPFSKVPLASLTPEAQSEIFSAWISHKPVVLTGGTGVGKTSQVPKLLLWFNYLFGGFTTLDKVSEFNERPVILSLPRIALVKLHSHTLLKSLGFKQLDGSPISLKFGSMPKELINRNPKRYGIIFSTHKLSLTKLFSYGTLIIDEVHEHDKIGDIIIAVARKHISKIDSMFLMTATLEDDRERLKVFLPDPIFIHIPGETLFKINEVFIHNKINPYNRFKYVEEEKLNLATGIRMYTPPPGSSGIVFVATVSQCNEYKKYLEKHLPYDIYIIHGKVPNIDDILDEIYRSSGISIIISTPYLESSVTIRNATHVYDTGKVFIPSPFGGSQKFISKSMRDQRKGRVGRVKPGTYVYFYDISYMETIQRIDSEFLHEYILYADKFDLTLPDDLFIIPTNLDILWDTKKYIESFNIDKATWDKLLSSYYIKMIEYAKLYNGNPIAKELDYFERTGELTPDVQDAIKSLNLKIQIIKSKQREDGSYMHICTLLFGVYKGKQIIINYHRQLRGYVYMISDNIFVPEY